MKDNQVCSNKGPDPPQRKDNHKKCKNGVGSFKDIIFQNHYANFNHNWHKYFLGEGDSGFFNLRG
jgi:hypothetical protein